MSLGVREKAARALEALKTPLVAKRKRAQFGTSEKMESLFSFKKKQKRGKQPLATKLQYAWKHRLVCLAYCDQTKIPTCDFEKDELMEAGLGEKEVEFGSYDMGFTEIKEVLYEEFPRLQEGGGFQLLKCTANSRVLEPLSKTVYTSLKILRQRVGQGRTYIRPLQRNLDLTPIFKITDAVSDIACYTINNCSLDAAAYIMHH